MEKLLQALRIGTINLFGITVPGFLIIFFLFAGLIVPMVNLSMVFSTSNWKQMLELYDKYTTTSVIFIIIISYVIGFILRLSPPDALDKISAQKVLKKMEKGERKLWPYTGDKNDKFPYFNFRKYLKARNLDHLLKHVKWGDGSAHSTKRSKTIINIMKLDILHRCPDLYAIVESNEAHIRLMSGTWLAIKNTIALVIIGSTISIATAVFMAFQLYPMQGKVMLTFHSTYSILLLFMCWSMFWAKKRIVNLFHYRRVSELLFIVQSAHIARSITKQK